MKPIIEVKDLKVIYNEGKANEYAALRGESLDIFPEEYIILFGPSGCGKSTLLYSILGILAPTGGKLLVKGEDVYKYNSDEMVKFQQYVISIIYQSFNLIPSLTTLDNVNLPLIFAGVPPGEREKRGMALLKRFGIEKQAKKVSTNLSGGQMQRIAVARSLINDPEILLADEPVGNLDSVSSAEVMDTLEDINMKDKKTIILVTHDAKFLPYAHRVYFMKDGGVEREVVNPEKKQIKSVAPGTTILTEIEKLARVYPYVSIEELKVKSIVNYLTQEVGFDQLRLVEELVEMTIKGAISDEKFMAALMAPLSRGGLEFSEGKARKMLEKTQSILGLARDIRQYRTRLQEKYASPKQAERIKGLRNEIIKECVVDISGTQIKWLDDNVASRAAGFISMEDFHDRLALPAEKKGGGFSEKQSLAISWYLEKLIAQGVHL